MRPAEAMREHGPEPVRGLPGRLPAGERVIWQGAPDWRAFAWRVFHLRAWAVYFAVLLAWYVATVMLSHAPAADKALSVLRVAWLPFAAIGLMVVFAWLIARTTVYTLTDKRLVIRFGIAFSMTINLPFAMVDAAALRAAPDGSGDIVLTLSHAERASYLLLWPHVRPWHLRRAEPMLRAVADAGRVAQLVSRALSAAAATPAQPVPDLAASGQRSRGRAAAAA